MCGFAGFLGTKILADRSDCKKTLIQMTDKIIHRGPDDADCWIDFDSQIGLGHRRLSILDLSIAGRQPMVSGSSRYVIIFNGEIYNHLLLRKDLETSGRAPIWRGYSDTETLLAGFDAWGIQETIKRTVGMFAFALWCKQTHVLTLGRDRMGEKPLYYGWQGTGESKVFLFGSEFKALQAHPAFMGSINRDAVCSFMRHSCIPAPHSIYKGIFKLLPGHLLSVSLKKQDLKLLNYWSGTKIVLSGVSNKFMGTSEQAINSLESLLNETIKQQMVADVPLGTFLSGGIDSSTIVALMQAQSTKKIKTFTIGFNEEGYNEAVDAKAVAQHLGTEHTELYVTPQQALAVIPNLPTIYDEPFSDSSQIPTFLVSQLARQKVTVSLSGDGGDELFCGYNRYRITNNLWNIINLLPFPLRKIIAKSILYFPSKSWNRLASLFQSSDHFFNFGERIHKGARLLPSKTSNELYLGLVSHFEDPNLLVIGGVEPSSFVKENEHIFNDLNPVQRMMAQDMMTYLPNDILTKLDRAAMSVSLETRVPFLNHRVVEFAWRLPQSYKLRAGQTKWILRQILYRHVPKKLIERPKVGFAVPIDEWLRGSLRDWAEELLNEKRMEEEGYFNTKQIQKKWAEHLSGKRNWQHHLWDVLMFQSWLRINN